MSVAAADPAERAFAAHDFAAPLAIGITGHRPERLEDYDVSQLPGAIADMLATIEESAPGSSFRLVSSLAEGADSLVTQLAIERGWSVDVVLPFAHEEYALDFDHPRATGELGDLVANARSLFELPGRRDEPGGSAAAYERAGRVMLAQSDLLIAIWDGGPARGRGGAAQMVSEAVGLGIPALCIHPQHGSQPELLWSGLDAHEFGPESVDSVARGTLADLPGLFARLEVRGAPAVERRRKPRRVGKRPLFAPAYPLLLAASGVRRLRKTDFFAVREAEADAGASVVVDLPDQSFAARIDSILVPRFGVADRAAALAAQMFRSAYVSNFALAALAVLLSLLGLLAPSALKPVLVIGEFVSIATILTITRTGSRANWHGRWLDARQIAERLRCLSLSARLGDLMLRGSDNGMQGASRDALEVARGLGLPSARVDRAYLAGVHASLIELIDEQTDYLTNEAGRMRKLEHRLHRLGGLLFATTAFVCAGVLSVELWLNFSHGVGDHHMPVALTVLSASLPAIGAAIYGIRMQGDFAGVAQRNAQLASQLGHLRKVAADEVPDFDGLRRIVRRVTELLTQDVSQWFRASMARPLSLPG